MEQMYLERNNMAIIQNCVQQNFTSPTTNDNKNALQFLVLKQQTTLRQS
jgi:hypothetical protein